MACLRRLASLQIVAISRYLSLQLKIWCNRASRSSKMDPKMLAYYSKSLCNSNLRTLWILSMYLRRLISLQILTISDLAQQMDARIYLSRLTSLQIHAVSLQLKIDWGYLGRSIKFWIMSQMIPFSRIILFYHSSID